MNLSPVKLTPWVTLCMITLIGVSYFVFLYATWMQFQRDKTARDAKIDDLLERIPKPAKPVSDES